MEEISEKIGLGTVQFGLDYGINNHGGKVPADEVRNIIKAYNNTLKPIYDTAIAYGNSQKVLGDTFKDLSIHNPDVVSKFPEVDNGKGLEKHLKDTLNELKTDFLYAFIAHNAKTLIENPLLIDKLQKFVAKRFIKKFGVSAYFPNEVEWFLKNDIPIGLVQVPYNFFDQRFEKVIEAAKQKGVEVHVRSAFLQGLIFKPIGFFDTNFIALKSRIQQIKGLQSGGSLAMAQIALSFCIMNRNIDKIIIGVDSCENLLQNLNFELSTDMLNQLQVIKNGLLVNDENIILPFNWPKP